MARLQQKMQAAGTTGAADHRHSLRDGLHAYTQSPWCAGLLATIVRAVHQRHRERNTSIGVSGRCDFTSAATPFVRVASYAAAWPRPSHPASRVVTIARNAPPW
ncbi:MULTISPECIES: hypothetical protein [unclassified Bradyrhizobium]|uniref:hypothetical protein n=1 Tax=unclassified Bradyrhizobium TaxID=2631580 RepID=UPI002915D98B|nr:MULTISPECIES: hypothetical protein [unclassified Bradyrhizobium]